MRALQVRREYSFYLQTLNFGDQFRTVINPFTGKTLEVPIDRGMTAAEIKSIQILFHENHVEGPEPEFEGYALRTDDGTSLRFRCHVLDADYSLTCIAVELVTPDPTDEVLNIILDVARAGCLALTSATGDGVRTIDDAPTSAQLARWPEAITIKTVADLRDWLSSTIGFREVRG